MNLRNTFIVVGVLGALTATTAYAKILSAQDFVYKASTATMFEIESSELAIERSQDSNVLNFAQQMIDDHTAVKEKMEDALASSQSQANPAMELDKKHQAMLDQLHSASNDNFDSQYISMQRDAHKKAVSLFSIYAKSGNDREIRAFARETLPTLKEHMRHVQHLSANDR